MHALRLFAVFSLSVSLGVLPLTSATAFDGFYDPYGRDQFAASSATEGRVAARFYLRIPFSGDRRVKTPPTRFGFNVTTRIPHNLVRTTWGVQRRAASLLDLQFAGDGATSLRVSGLPAFQSRLYADGNGNTERRSETNWTYIVLGVLAAGGLAIALTSGGNNKNGGAGDDQNGQASGNAASPNDGADPVTVDELPPNQDPKPVDPLPSQEAGTGPQTAGISNQAVFASQDAPGSITGIVASPNDGAPPTTFDGIPPSVGPVMVEPIESVIVPVVTRNTFDFGPGDDACLGQPGIGYVNPSTGDSSFVSPGGC